MHRAFYHFSTFFIVCGLFSLFSSFLPLFPLALVGFFFIFFIFSPLPPALVSFFHYLFPITPSINSIQLSNPIIFVALNLLQLTIDTAQLLHTIFPHRFFTQVFHTVFSSQVFPHRFFRTTFPHRFFHTAFLHSFSTHSYHKKTGQITAILLLPDPFVS